MLKNVKLYIFLCLIFCVMYISTNVSYAQNTQGVYNIAVGASKVISLSEPIKRISIGNPGVVEYTVISKNEILLLGLKVGKTELHLWTDNDFKMFIVKVYDDILEFKTKLFEVMGPEIANAISVHVAREALILKGQVATSYESEQVEKIASLYYPKVVNLIEVKKDKLFNTTTSINYNFNSETEIKENFKNNYSNINIHPNQCFLDTVNKSVNEQIIEQYPRNYIGNTKDILEINAFKNFKENNNSYGNGALINNSSTYLPSMTIPKSHYENVNDKTTKIITLQNAQAADLEAALSKIKSPDGLVVKDDRTNTLVLIDKPSILEKMENIIKVLDAPAPQVLIEAKIVEVSLTDDMKNTLNWIYDTLYGASNPFGTSLNNKSVKISEGSLDLTLDYGKISSEHFTMKILPSLQKRHARLISAPSTVTLDKKEATFGVTDNIPYLKYTPQGTTGTLLPTPEYVAPAPGVTLRVTPIINQDDVIRMAINVQIGSFVENVNFGQYGSVPRTSSRQSSNVVEVKNGETIIISGLISNRAFNSANKVPWFAKIPIIGHLFESKIKGSERTELVIFITPKIVGRDSRYAILDKEKYPKIVENKMPDVSEKFDFKNLFNKINEKVNSNYSNDTKQINYNVTKIEANDDNKKLIESNINMSNQSKDNSNNKINKFLVSKFRSEETNKLIENLREKLKSKNNL